MQIFPLARNEWFKLEALFGLMLALIALGYPSAWWLKTALSVALAALLLHLCFASPLTIGLAKRLRIAISFVTIAISMTILWISSRSPGDRMSTVAPTVTNQELSATIDNRRRVSVAMTDSASTNAWLREDAEQLIRDLRTFQLKLDEWYRNADQRLRPEDKNVAAHDELRYESVERAKELNGSMAELTREFERELKPRVIAMKDRLQNRVSSTYSQPNPPVDWTFQNALANGQNAMGNMADYLESLARQLPEK